MTRTELGAVARLARRTARREWKRTLLIVLLIAVPVAVAIVTAGVLRAGTVTEREGILEDFGAADLRIKVSGDSDDAKAWLAQELETRAPGATVAVARTFSTGVAGTGADVTDIDPTSPLAEGRVRLTDGTRPVGRGEVAISADILDRLGASIGDIVSIPIDNGHDYELVITGIVQKPLWSESRLLVVHSEQFDDFAKGLDPGAAAWTTETWLVAVGDAEEIDEALSAAWAQARPGFLPDPQVTQPPELAAIPDEFFRGLSEADVAVLLEAAASAEYVDLTQLALDLVDHQGLAALPDMSVISRSRNLRYAVEGWPEYQSRLEQPQVIGTLIAGLLLAEVALVAGAAYATGTRRRLREIGLLGANGATNGHVRSMVIGEGLVAGIIGAGVGTGLAITVMTLGRPIVQRYVDKLITGFSLTPADVAGPVVAAIVATTLASWIPARTASRVPTATALQGRMPLRAPYRWLPLVGISVGALGSILVGLARSLSTGKAAFAGGSGVILMIAGAALLTGPLVAWAGRHADRFRATARLVLRDSARQRTRAAAAISAIMVVLLALVVIGVNTDNMKANDAVHGLPTPGNQVVILGQAEFYETGSFTATAEDVARVQAVVPQSSAEMLQIIDADVTLPSGPVLTFGDLRRGGAAIAGPNIAAVLGEPRIAEELANGKAVVLGVTLQTTYATVGGNRVPAIELPVPVIHYSMPRVLVPLEVTTDLGFSSLGTAAIVTTNRDLSEVERQAIWDLRINTSLPDRAALTRQQGLYVAMAITLLVVLVVIAIVTALSATESDHDVRLMVAVGAPPALRRRFFGLQTALYVFLGGTLASPLGWLLMKVTAEGGGFTSIGPFGTVTSDFVAVPWLTIAVVVSLMPLVAGGATALLVRSASTVPPRPVG